MIELSAFDTYQFVKSMLPQPAQTILEVGYRSLHHISDLPQTMVTMKYLLSREAESSARITPMIGLMSRPPAGSISRTSSNGIKESKKPGRKERSLSEASAGIFLSSEPCSS